MLTPDELQRAAMAARIARKLTSKDAAKQSSPGTREAFAREAQLYGELAEKLEALRRGHRSER